MRLPFKASRRRQGARAAQTAALDSTVEASKVAGIHANIDAIDEAESASTIAWIAIGISALGLAVAVASFVVAVWC